MPPSSSLFPPRPPALKGRRAELVTLERMLVRGETSRLALVGSGGSGKSVLACAVGHRVAKHFAGGIHWFRVGAWDHRTLLQMVALRFGAIGDEQVPRLRARLAELGPLLIVLDNHESDAAMARFLDALRDLPVTWLLTARRCLLSGVSVFPVIAPLVTSGRSAFPRVAALTRLLRWNPLALDIADAIVASKAASVARLSAWLVDSGVERVAVMAHEDDVAEVRLLLDFVWPRLGAGERALLSVLAWTQGDHVDAASLYALAQVEGESGKARSGLGPLLRWRLVQEPLAGRFTLHAVLRYALQRRLSFPSERFFEHYLALCERHPERVEVEQTHLFAAMDYAYRISDFAGALRLERLLGATA